ncbi:MAG: DUF308 domain-containing protein [Muribaculaceae bacterium]|nr:DUF308 domain-containing protein [Muribaculaceae bacterium]
MLRHAFLSGISRYWWLPLLTGLICIALGVWTLCTPTSALPVIAAAFAYCLILLGIFDAGWGFSTSRINPSWGWDICLAALDIVAGVWMLTMNTGEMTLTFLYIVAIWIIFAAFSGIGQMLAVSYRNAWATFFGMLLLITTIILTFWLIINPVSMGVLAWIWLAIALICYGTFRVMIAFRIRKLR